MQVSKVIMRSAKNALGRFSDIELTIRDATSNAPSNPSLVDLQEIAEYSHYEMYEEKIIAMLEKRLNEKKGKNWRHVFKTLLVLEHLLVDGGGTHVIRHFQRNLYIVKTLKEFQHIEDKLDRGAIVRDKASEVCALLIKFESTRRPRALTTTLQASPTRDVETRSRSKSEPMPPPLPRRPTKPMEDTSRVGGDTRRSETAVIEERQNLTKEKEEEDLFDGPAVASKQSLASLANFEAAQMQFQQQQFLAAQQQQQAYNDELQRQSQASYFAQPQQQQYPHQSFTPPSPFANPSSLSIQTTGFNSQNPFAAFNAGGQHSPMVFTPTYSPMASPALTNDGSTSSSPYGYSPSSVYNVPTPPLPPSNYTTTPTMMYHHHSSSSPQTPSYFDHHQQYQPQKSNFYPSHQPPQPNWC